MKNIDSLGDFFAEIGNILVQESGNIGDQIFIYREFESGVIGGVSFKEFDDHVEWLDTDSVNDYMLRFWEGLPISDRWKAIRYSISGSKFQAELDYGEDWVDGEVMDDRVLRIEKARFGNKRVDYGELP